MRTAASCLRCSLPSYHLLFTKHNILSIILFRLKPCSFCSVVKIGQGIRLPVPQASTKATAFMQCNDPAQATSGIVPLLVVLLCGTWPRHQCSAPWVHQQEQRRILRQQRHPCTVLPQRGASKMLLPILLGLQHFTVRRETSIIHAITKTTEKQSVPIMSSTTACLEQRAFCYPWQLKSQKSYQRDNDIYVTSYRSFHETHITTRKFGTNST